MSLPAIPARFELNYPWDALRRDLVAGATVAAIAIPQAMAYALIAGVDPRFGLYSRHRGDDHRVDPRFVQRT